MRDREKGAGSGDAAATRALWRCPTCARTFAAQNQVHTCKPLGTLERHFAGKPAVLRATFDAFAAAVRTHGDVDILPETSRIAFHTRMSFAQLTVRSAWLDGHVVLGRRAPHERFRRIDTISARNHVHHFRLTGPEDVDDDVRGWIAEAWEVGAQRHLSGARSKRSRGGAH